MIAKLGKGITLRFAKRAVTRVAAKSAATKCLRAHLFEICRNNIMRTHTHTLMKSRSWFFQWDVKDSLTFQVSKCLKKLTYGIKKKHIASSKPPPLHFWVLGEFLANQTPKRHGRHGGTAQGARKHQLITTDVFWLLQQMVAWTSKSPSMAVGPALANQVYLKKKVFWFLKGSDNEVPYRSSLLSCIKG